MKLFPVLLTLGLGILLGSVWKIQMARGTEYQKKLERQSARRIRLPAVRGRIFDRNGICLADNRPVYRIGLFPGELRRPGPLGRTVDAVMETAQRIGELIGYPPDLTREQVVRHLRTRQPLMLIGWSDVDPQTLAAFAERAPGVSGADIDVVPRRTYPEGPALAHVVGYVGQPDRSEATDVGKYHFYVPSLVGKSGIEASMEDVLAGQAGGQLVRVDVSGYKFGEITQREAVPGDHVVLSIDVRCQKRVYDLMKGRVGAVVVVDPRNGDVLAMVSSPSFNPNQLISPVDPVVWAALRDDPDHPLVDRAIRGLYMPGSTFKPIVALAGLAAGVFDPRDRVVCRGVYRVGNRPFRCWYAPGHGPLDLRGALCHSCNVFFYGEGLKTGPEAIEAMARAFGLGERTGIALPHESAGIVRRRRPGERIEWYDGDTANLSIGQGRIAATPLQMAMAAAALANGGILYEPRLVLRVTGPDGRVIESRAPVVRRRIDVDPSDFQAVREGMLAVVQDPMGTGREARVPGVRIAGKTGTAQRASDSQVKDTWFIGFAPFERPRYAVAVVVEKGQSGGKTAAPIGGRIFEFLLGEGAS